jgi:hypothetical protein
MKPPKLSLSLHAFRHKQNYNYHKYMACRKQVIIKDFKISRYLLLRINDKVLKSRIKAVSIKPPSTVIIIIIIIIITIIHF